VFVDAENSKSRYWARLLALSPPKGWLVGWLVGRKGRRGRRGVKKKWAKQRSKKVGLLES